MRKLMEMLSVNVVDVRFKKCRHSKSEEINLCQDCRDLSAPWSSLSVWLLLNPIHNWLVFLEKSPTASHIKFKGFFFSIWLLHDPNEFAYYIAENWILRAWANYCLTVDIPLAAWGSEKKRAGRHLKPLLKIMWFFHLADKNVSWNVSLFWTLSIFFLLLQSLLRGTKINPASYYCWFRWGKRVGELFAVMVVGSSSGICSDSDDAGRRQSS